MKIVSAEKQIKFLITWSICNLFGWAVGVFIGLWIGQFRLESFAYLCFSSVAVSPITSNPLYLWLPLGGGIGVAQWLKLRKWNVNFLSWVLVTIAGLCIPIVLLLVVSNYHGAPCSPYDFGFGVLSLLFIGFCLGLAQSIVLEKLIPGKIYWIFANSIGFLVVLVSVFIIGITYPWVIQPEIELFTHDFFSYVIVWTVFSFIGSLSAFPAGIVILEHSEITFAVLENNSRRHRKLKRMIFLSIIGALIYGSILLIGYLPKEVIGRHGINADFEKIYQIDSDTIMVEIQQESDKQLFELLDDYSGWNKLEYTEQEYFWSSSDYYLVVKAFVDQVIKENLDNWRIDRLRYNTSCRNTSAEFVSGSIAVCLEQITDSRVRYRDCRLIMIFPSSSEIMEVGFEYTTNKPNEYLKNWEFMDLSQIEISAEQAMAISRESIRDKIPYENSCETTLMLVNKRGSLYWAINQYFPNDSLESLDVYVDATTGEISVFE